MDSLVPIGLGLSVDGEDPVLSVTELGQTRTYKFVNKSYDYVHTCLCEGFM